jgi:hypothetical protein
MAGTYAAAVQRVLIGRVVASLGALVTAVGTFMPWLRSGARRRNSYEIFSLIDRLGFSSSSLVGWGVRLWPILPFLLVAAITLQWFPRKWMTGGAAVVAVAYTAIVSVAVRSAPSSSLISVEFGPVVTLIGAVTMAAGALLTATLPTGRASPLTNRQ